MTQYLKMGIKVAKQSRHAQHHMACIIVRGGAVLASAANGPAGRGHAEARAVRPHGDYRGATAVVVRTNGRKTSKPCPHCAEKLKRAGVSYCVYTDSDGILKRVKTGEL